MENRVEMELSIEANSNLESLNAAFKVLESIATKNEISSHISSRIGQIIDLRNRSWNEADRQRNQNFRRKEDSILKEGGLCCLRGQTSIKELQLAIDNDTGAIQDFNEYPKEDQTFSRSTRDVNESLEGGDCVDRDELAITLNVTNILNGLTWHNIQQRQEEIKALTIDTEKRLLAVSNLIYEQAISSDPAKSPLLARICFALMKRGAPSAKKPSKIKLFSQVLLDHCQADFNQKRLPPVDVLEKKKQIQKAKTEKMKKELETELEDYLISMKKSRRNIRFIGELFKVEMFPPNILSRYIRQLSSECESEESLECLCILLTTVGKEIEYRKKFKIKKSYSKMLNMKMAFDVLESVVTGSDMSNHIRSRIQEVIDLRNHNWIDKNRDHQEKEVSNKKVDGLSSLRGQTSNVELQSAIGNDTSAIQNSQSKSSKYPIEDQTFFRSTRDHVNESTESSDCVDRDELAITQTVTNILNGLTWHNIQQRQKEIKALTIDTEKRLLLVLNLIYEQAISSDPAKSPLFAKICFVLMERRAPSAKNPSKVKLFRKLLLAHCLIDFDNKRLPDVVFFEKKKEIQNAKTEKMKKELGAELEEYLISRKKSRANIRFIGELFKVEMFPPNILSRCIRRLSSESKSEESLECLCILLITVGEEIEYRKKFKVQKATSNVLNMKMAFDVLESVVTVGDMSNHIRSRIQEVIDLRNRNWIDNSRDHQVEKNSDQIVDGLGSLGGQTSNEELQSAIDNDTGAIQDSQSNEMEDHTLSHLTREQQELNESIEDGDCGYKDELAMPAATKCALFSTIKNDRFGQNSLPFQNPGFRDCLSSPQFHENLVTDPDLVMFQSPPKTREMSKDALLGKSTIEKEDIEQKSLELLITFFTNDQNVEGAVLEMKNWLHKKTIAEFIYQCLLLVYELGREERRVTSSLIKEMVKRYLFNPSDVKEGYTKFLQMAEDWIVRFPNLLWESAVELVEPLFEEGAINLQFLSELSSILNSSLATDFVAAVLKELVSVQSVAGAGKLWIMSNASFASVLPAGADPKAFLTRHMELEFLSKSDW